MKPITRILLEQCPVVCMLSMLSSIAAATAPQAGPVQETGVPGTVAPQSADVRLADTLVNQDTTGGSNQALLALAASPGAGFAAVWRDQRDGTLALYLARMNAQGELLEPERPIHRPYSGRQLEPSVALGKDNSGAVVWISATAGANVPWVRAFDAHGNWLCPDRALISNEEIGNARGGREGGSHMPVVVALPHGGYAVAWTQGGQVKYLEIEHDGSPHGKTVRIAPSSPPAEGGVQMAISNRGVALCVWRTSSGNMAASHGRTESAPVNCGMGVLCRLITDPVGGFWAALTIEGQAVLRHLSVEGRPDRPDIRPISAVVTGLDLALGDECLVLLTESSSTPRGELRGEGRGAGEAGKGEARGGDAAGGERGDKTGGEKAGGDKAGGDKAGGDKAGGDKTGGDKTGGDKAGGDKAGGERGGDKARAGGERRGGGEGNASGFTVYLLDRDGRSNDTPRPVRGASANASSPKGARIAASGKRAFVAWTDLRNGDSDIYGRALELSVLRTDAAGDSDPRLGAEHRVNTDVASSDQNSPRIAGWGDHAVIVWQDGRDRVNKSFARVIGPSGFLGDEFSVPVPFGDAGVSAEASAYLHPIVAVRANGEFAVQWKELSARGSNMRVQCFRATKEPLGAPVTIDDVREVPTHAIAALGEDRGYLTAWVRGAKEGVWARRLMPDGKLTPAVRVAEAQDGEPGDLAVALLDDQRLILVWHVHAAGDAYSLRARFIDSDGATKSDEIAFDPSPRKMDWQPCVAPAANNGFVIGWCSGPPSDPSHDVMARVFDAHGKPAGPMLPISPMAHEQDYAQIARLTDKSYVIAWEDDISYFDHTYVRRILPSGRELGPVVRLNELETKFVEDRTGPQIAVLGDGLVGAWNDRRRSQGWDVYLRILGPKFDDTKKR